MTTVLRLPGHLWIHLAEAVLVFVVAGLVARGGGRLIGRLELRQSARGEPLQARRATLFRLATSVLRYTVDFIAVVTVLGLFGVPTGSLVAGAGILGLAVSFGAQGLVQDVVTGLFLLYEDQFAVGDQITLPALALSGTVTEVGLRVTRLNGLTGEAVILPNRLILEVQNHTRGKSSLTVTIPVSADADPTEVATVLKRLADELQTTMPGLQVQGITALLPGQVVWSLTAPAPYGEVFRVGLALRRRVADALFSHGIALAGGVKGPSGPAYGQSGQTPV
ncbi:MAG: mechanosensitive ion channel family protein [Thermaerobacter sp.]|nr:mechanosensitive ion channel family protein [Thermaerobacter sp.]